MRKQCCSGMFGSRPRLAQTISAPSNVIGCASASFGVRCTQSDSTRSMRCGLRCEGTAASNLPVTFSLSKIARSVGACVVSALVCSCRRGSTSCGRWRCVSATALLHCQQVGDRDFVPITDLEKDVGVVHDLVGLGFCVSIGAF